MIGGSWARRVSRDIVRSSVSGDKNKVVWILGAGFSVPLGGPLFRKLISGETARSLYNWSDYAKQSWEARTPHGPQSYTTQQLAASISAEIVYTLYSEGVEDKNKRGQIALWNDAEQFLERLEIAADEPESQLAMDLRETLVAMRGHSTDDRATALLAFQDEEVGLELLHQEAARFVAGACSVFLSRAEQNPRIVDTSEQWDPYRRWVGILKGGSDSVITFNYDRTLDILGEYCRRQLRRDPFFSPVGITADRFEAFSKSSVPTYHLHGHVGWRRSRDDESIELQPAQGGFQTNRAIAHRLPERAVIGIPGKHKLSLPDGLLKDTWDKAMAAVREAGAVVFVGYRFPETDNMAKRRLIDALKANHEGVPHIVLGANNQDMPRLKGMIEWTGNRQKPRNVNPVRVHELWAQDFLAVFDRNGLFRQT